MVGQGFEEEKVRHEDDHGGRRPRPGQGGESAEPNREMAPAKRDYVRGQSQARGNNLPQYRSGTEDSTCLSSGDTSWLWDQEKEASRELQYHKGASAPTYSQRRLTTIALCGTPKPWGARVRKRPTRTHRQQLECNAEHGESGAGGGAPVQGKWTNGRVDANRLTNKNLQDHKQERTELERRCIQSDS